MNPASRLSAERTLPSSVIICVLVSPMKIRVLSISSGPLGPHASCVHEVSLVHARYVRSQRSGPMNGATETNFHSQWRIAGLWKLVVNVVAVLTTKTQGHQEIATEVWLRP